MSRYIDPTTDFGFKKLFGEEANKDLILSFLNDLLELEIPLFDLSFPKTERLPETAEERKGFYDVFCQDAAGNHFLVEMQKSGIAWIKDRMLYYSTFPIVAQAKKGKSSSYPFPSPEVLRIRDATSVVYGEKEFALESEWDYELKAVYCIAVLGYTLDGSKKVVNRNSLRNDEPPHELYYDKLKFVTVELPLFNEHRPEYSLDRHRNKWLYFLKYTAVLDHIPSMFKNDPIFRKAFRVAELARLTPQERQEYETNVKYMRDAYAMWKTSRDEGRAEGRAEGRMEGRGEGLIEGEKKGKIKKGQETLHLLFSQKLGPLPADITEAIRDLDNEAQIDEILARFIEINDWETLKKYLE